jgi:hypothetical protein
MSPLQQLIWVAVHRLGLTHEISIWLAGPGERTIWCSKVTWA